VVVWEFFLVASVSLQNFYTLVSSLLLKDYPKRIFYIKP